MKINKAKLDVLIAMVKEYWENEGDNKKRCQRIQEYYEDEFPGKADIYAFVRSIISAFGIKPDATNEDIYKALEVLGCEVER